MRVVAISDLHLKWKKLDGKLPEGDLLIICGDITNQGRPVELQQFNKWVGEQPYKHKVCIAGNHDFGLAQAGPRTVQQSILTNMIYLEDSGVTLDGISIWGSPWTPRFYNWAFMKDEEDLVPHWDVIPEGVDILVTHGPPYGVLDLTARGIGAGSFTLRDAVRRVKPQVHLFGHIHEARGCEHQRWEDGSATVFFNATIMNHDHRPENVPWVFDIWPRA